MDAEEKKRRIESRRRGNRNTSAKILGDPVDLIIKQVKDEKKMNYPRQFSDYPETIRPTLQVFVESFNFPHSAIPFAINKSAFSLWIKELTKINDICGTHKNVVKAMKLAKQRYDSSDKRYFVLSRPGSLMTAKRNLITDAMTQIKNSPENNKAYNKKPQKIVVDEERTIQTAKKLKRLLNEE